ncbi:UNVERIFIED_CONTAM: G-type lectin S-receptor-like serine/threonine-protein kinase [Sesamum radiatum]|uniref:non-specific serine/threonine protein kinase n=1 Tax=Sesamum radiatum TaxID=300843 RepID=A0AAW2P3T0_SESRA
MILAFVEVAERYLLDEPEKRPTMAQVVLQLEFALEQQESKQLPVLNEIASVFDDIHPRDYEIGLMVNTGPLTMASTVQNLTCPPNEQTKSKVVNAEVPAGIKDDRKAKMHKSSRPWAWPLDAFWNRVKSSKKDESLLSGQVIAVKRLSPSSILGIDEFNNEILLLANLQHRNIIELLGCCTHRDEKLLVYEFMENRRVDTLIVCLNIIMGIARGLVYLHQDSGLRIVHRSIRTSTILLDNKMNPKISVFALAKTLANNQSEPEAGRVVETYNLMPPEYAMHGILSFKSDVYSFGVTVLEIVSGKRFWSYIPNHESMHLLDYAWMLWNEGKAADLVDESVVVGGAFLVEEAIICIQVGLLCTGEDPNHRPEIHPVLKLLEGEELIAEPQTPWPLLTSGHDGDQTFEVDDTLEK